MSDLKREQLSGFVDGEMKAGGGHIADHLLKDQTLMGAWSRYHLLSDCLNRQLPEYLGKNLAGDVARLIQDEPPILAPDHTMTNNMTNSGANAMTNAASSFMKPFAGFAIAASVTAMAILGIQQQRVEDQDAAPQAGVIPVDQYDVENNTWSTIPGRSPQVPIRYVSSRTPDYGYDDADQRRQMNRYIVNYNEYRTDLGMQGIIPYVRIVAHSHNE